MSVWPPEGSPLAVTPEMEQAMKKMNYPVIKVRNHSWGGGRARHGTLSDGIAAVRVCAGLSVCRNSNAT